MQELNLIKKKKERISKILIDIESTEDEEMKLQLYKEVIKLDNTDRNILRQYLLLFKKLRKTTDEKESLKAEIMTYINYFPPEEFNKDFSDYGKKEISSMGKLLLFLNEILKKDWSETTYEERRVTSKYFLNTIKQGLVKLKNTSPITWENDELYIFCYI